MPLPTTAHCLPPPSLHCSSVAHCFPSPTSPAAAAVLPPISGGDGGDRRCALLFSDVGWKPSTSLHLRLVGCGIPIIILQVAAAAADVAAAAAEIRERLTTQRRSNRHTGRQADTEADKDEH